MKAIKKARVVSANSGEKGGGVARKPARGQRAPAPASVAAMVESVVGCKWSLRVLAAVRSGVNRPGALTRAIPGLTSKVLAERLEKFVRFGIFERRSYPEIPPRVEYALTPFGERFASILDAVEALERDADALGGLRDRASQGGRATTQ